MTAEEILRQLPQERAGGGSTRRPSKGSRGGLRLSAAPALLLLALAPAAYAANSVVIKIKTQPSSALAPGFSGFNTPQPRNGVEYFDPKFMAAVAPLKPGWVRYPGGSVSLDFDWTTGHTNMDWMNSLLSGDPPLLTGQATNILPIAQELTQTKGGVLFSDFAAFANVLGAAAIICFNSYTDNNPGSATQMALAAQSYALNVVEWELSNEAYLYPAIYPTAAAYASAAQSYFNDIRTASPAAVVGLFYAGLYTGASGNYSSWDPGMVSYTPQFWNAASNHIYPITKSLGAQATMFALNGYLAHGSSDYINSYLVPLAGANTPIFITEFNCCTQSGNKFLSYLYNGIFLAEYTARLSSLPNVKGVGVNSLYTDNSDYHGLIQSVDDFESYLLGQYAINPDFSTNTATDPNTQFQFYVSAPGLAMEVANQAINSSARVWPTTVTGGPTVNITGFDGVPIPAIYAQAYFGNGRHYLLITNKSSQSDTVTIDLNGAKVQGTLNLTYVTNSSPTAANTAQSPTNVQIQTRTSTNPIHLAGYSVTTVTW